MNKQPLRQPTKRSDAEIILKRNFGLGSMFSDGNISLYEGISIFANRRGYRFLSDFFRWLAERPTTECDTDPGDHVHLIPTSSCSDDIAFSFDTLTLRNRNKVLRNAKATKHLRRWGTPFRQFTGLVAEIAESLEGYLKNDQQFRRTTIQEIDALVAVLEEKRTQLERM